MSTYLSVTRDGPVATLAIDRAERRNAFSQDMWQALQDQGNALACAPGLGAVVIKSARPGIFSAGADIAEFDRIRQSREAVIENADLVEAAMTAICAIPCPTIAVIDGNCFGGGTALALCCDFRLASARARFAITPARLGLGFALHDVNRVVQTVGLQWARRLLLLAETLDAQTALACNLVDHVSDDIDALEARFLGDLLALSPQSQSAIKSTLALSAAGVQGPHEADRARYFDSFQSRDLAEGMTAFLEKRPARFRDPD